MKQKTICVVTKSDKRFFKGIVALINSLNYVELKIKIYVFDFGLTRKQALWLQNKGCIVQSIVPKYFPHPSTVYGTNYNESIYALLYADKIEGDIVVHFDADVVVVGGFLEFLMKLKEFDFIAPTDYPPLSLADQIGSQEGINYLRDKYDEVPFDELTLSTNSINAGIWAIPIAKFNVLRTLMLEIFHDCERLDIVLPMRDQSILNIALHVGRFSVCRLDFVYNFRAHFRRSPELLATVVDNSEFPPKIRYKDRDVHFIHFIGSKPWRKLFVGDNRLKDTWSSYFKREKCSLSS